MFALSRCQTRDLEWKPTYKSFFFFSSPSTTISLSLEESDTASDYCNYFIRAEGAAQHSGSIPASHPAAPSSNPGYAKFFLFTA